MSEHDERRAPDDEAQLHALARAEAEGRLPDQDRRQASQLHADACGDVGDVGDVGDLGSNARDYVAPESD